MKKISLILLLITTQAYAFIFEIKDVCQQSSFYKEDIQIFAPASAGHLTISILELLKVDYIGSEHGISSIFQTPIGLEAIDVIAEDHMKVFGWCYEIDGKQPTILTSEYIIEPKEIKNITWFYGYAELKDGIWKNYCIPCSEKQ